MKSNKLVILLALGLMACGPVAFAQDKPATTPPPPAAGDTTTPPRRGNRGGLQAILKQLDLTADQNEKIKPILADQREKMTALRDSSPTPEDRRAKMKEINEAVDAKLKDILTADQFTKFQELRKQAGNGRRRNTDAGTPPTPAPDAPKTDKN